MFAPTIYRYRLDEVIRKLTVIIRMTDIKVGNVAKFLEKRGLYVLSVPLAKGAITPPLSALAFGRLGVLELNQQTNQMR